MQIVTPYKAPLNRHKFVPDGIEYRITEAAVMLAVALHFLAEHPGAIVHVHPDGEHAKCFNIVDWLSKKKFQKVKRIGGTDYGGIYRNGEQEIHVDPRSGLGDVECKVNGQTIVVAECKGGTINSRHSGQKSRLRRGLYEAVGLLMARPIDGTREMVAVPRTLDTERVSERLALRCKMAGLDIALVGDDGSIMYVTPSHQPA